MLVTYMNNHLFYYETKLTLHSYTVRYLFVAFGLRVLQNYTNSYNNENNTDNVSSSHSNEQGCHNIRPINDEM
jgi:hypothetical protein